MLKIDRAQRRFTNLPTNSLSGAKLSERYDLQRMIAANPDAFFAELGEPLLLLGEEVRPTSFVDDRIDLLALDREAAIVVIELKRDSHKLQLIQALSYAAMISSWTLQQLIAQRARFSQKPNNSIEDEIENFVLEELEAVNKKQRVVLIAEDFDYEVLATAEWLSEKYDLDIRCYKLVLSTDGDSEYVGCVCIYPPAEISQQAIRRSGRQPTTPIKWKDWNEALAALDNREMADFFDKELKSGRSNYLRRRILRYMIGGRRRWWVAARNKAGYVWQTGRFEGDEDFWRSRISDPDSVQPVKDRRCLRMNLSTQNDFEAFQKAAIHELLDMPFASASNVDDDSEDEE